MQKYIAVVNPRMEEGEISQLIAKGIAGALFSISHQDYHKAARLIELIKKLARKYNRPVSIVQDVSEMQDPMDLNFGMRNGVHWVASSDPMHLKMVKGLNKLAGLIYKGRNLPKGLRVDSIMDSEFLDPDAEVMGEASQIKHLTVEHKNQQLLDSLIDMAHNSDASSIVSSDLDLARSLAFRRSGKKIIFAPKNHEQTYKAALYPGLHPIFANNDLNSSLLSSKIADKNDRILDARNIKHVAIHLIS